MQITRNAVCIEGWVSAMAMVSGWSWHLDRVVHRLLQPDSLLGFPPMPCVVRCALAHACARRLGMLAHPPCSHISCCITVGAAVWPSAIPMTGWAAQGPFSTTSPLIPHDRPAELLR